MWAQGRRLQSSDFALAPDWLYDLGRLFSSVPLASSWGQYLLHWRTLQGLDKVGR